MDHYEHKHDSLCSHKGVHSIKSHGNGKDD